MENKKGGFNKKLVKESNQSYVKQLEDKDKIIQDLTEQLSTTPSSASTEQTKQLEEENNQLKEQVETLTNRVAELEEELKTANLTKAGRVRKALGRKPKAEEDKAKPKKQISIPFYDDEYGIIVEYAKEYGTGKFSSTVVRMAFNSMDKTINEDNFEKFEKKLTKEQQASSTLRVVYFTDEEYQKLLEGVDKDTRFVIEKQSGGFRNYLRNLIHFNMQKAKGTNFNVNNIQRYIKEDSGSRYYSFN